MSADAGTRMGGGGTGNPQTVTLREFLLAQIHALDERLNEALKQRDERATERMQMLEHAAENRLNAANATVLARTEALQGQMAERQKAMVDLINLRADMSETAVMKASTAMEKRLDTMNEFRSQLKDQSATFISRVESDAARMMITDRIDRENRSVDARIKMLEQKNANIDGRFAMLSIFITFGVLLVNFAMKFLVLK